MEHSEIFIWERLTGRAAVGDLVGPGDGALSQESSPLWEWVPLCPRKGICPGVTRVLLS